MTTGDHLRNEKHEVERPAPAQVQQRERVPGRSRDHEGDRNASEADDQARSESRAYDGVWYLEQDYLW